MVSRGVEPVFLVGSKVKDKAGKYGTGTVKSWDGISYKVDFGKKHGVLMFGETALKKA